MIFIRASLFVLCGFLLAACQSGGGSPSGPGGRGSGARTKEKPIPLADTWIIAYDPRSGGRGVTMILVNETHPWLKTKRGKKRLALGRRNQGYKTLSNRQMKALVAGLEKQGYFAFASDFKPGDDALLDPARNPSDRYRGMIFTQIGDRRSKLVGWRGESAEKQKRLSNCRLLVAMVYNRTNEMMGGGEWRVQ